MARDYVLQPFENPVELQIDYQAALNPQQLAAVTAPPGPALVIAGAGAGKTRTLIYRVAYLLEQGITPDRLLLLTFTNKAAKEMMGRVAELLGEDLTGLWGGTFHSVGNRILRRHARLLGFGADFTILDREDSRDVMATCLENSEIDVTAGRFPKADVLCDIASLAVNRHLSIDAIIDDQYDYFFEVWEEIKGLVEQYQRRKQELNSMDFDDLLVLWLKLLREHELVREHYQNRFQFILVDEYQDTNQLQADLVDLLGARHKNVTVVGDDSQSIYSWRGANFENIIAFPERYPGAALYKIETNYRSTPQILETANAAIAPNLYQYPKELRAVRKAGPKPVLVPCATAREQAAFVAQRVLELRDEGIALQSMAVLYRSHFHALELQLELTRRNIPFVINSGIRFFDQAHVKDVTAYLKWVRNPLDEISFKRLVRMLSGVGGKKAAKLWEQVQKELPGRVPAAEEVPAQAPLGEILQRCVSLLSQKTLPGWAQFSATIHQLQEKLPADQPATLLRLVMDAVYEDYLKETFPNYRVRQEDIEQLIIYAGQYQSLDAFLSEMALMTHLAAEDHGPAKPDDEQLKLSSIHQAKGLEFDVVFIIMLCDGLFPSARSLEAEEDEEERRLFYVAVTRARDELYLTYPLIRVLGNSQAEVRQRRSRFLSDIPVDLLEEVTLRVAPPSFRPGARASSRAHESWPDDCDK